MRNWAIAGCLGLATVIGSLAQSIIQYAPFGGTESIAEVVSVPGDGLYIVGHTNAFGSQDVMVIKYDFQGNILWSYVYEMGLGDDERAYGAAPVQGGGVVIAGELRRIRDGLALYIDATGNVVFARQYTGSRALFEDVIQHSNTNFYFVGKERMGGGREEIVVWSLDLNGNTNFKIYYDDRGNGNTDWGTGLIELANGDIAVIGYTDDAGTDDWLIMSIDPANGNIIQAPSYLRSPVRNENPWEITYDNAGNLYIVGFWRDPAVGARYPAIAKFDPNFTYLTGKYFPVPGGGEARGASFNLMTNTIYFSGQEASFGESNILFGEIDLNLAIATGYALGSDQSNETNGFVYYDPTLNKFFASATTDFAGGLDAFVMAFDSLSTLRCGVRTISLLPSNVPWTQRAYNLTATPSPTVVNNLTPVMLAGPATNGCYCPISADFGTTADPYVCTGDSVYFNYIGDTLGNLTYMWTFGDSAVPTTSMMREPMGVVYAAEGSKTVTLAVSDAACQTTVSKAITVHETPTVSFSVSNMQPCEGEPVAFTNTGSTGPGWTFTWDFDVDAVPETSNDENPTGVYWTGPGPKNVVFTISSAYCSNTASMVIAVQDKPVADFTIANRVCQGDTTEFTFNGEALTGATYSWTVNGGSPAMGTMPDMASVFGPTGWRDVSLIVTNQNGCADTAIKQIYVDSLPDVQFTVTDATPCEGEPVDFTNTGTSGPEWTFTWDFDVDASPNVSNAENPTGVYWTSPGAKTVIFTISSPYCTNTGSMTINVQDKPVVDFALPARVCQGDTVELKFTGDSLTGAKFKWTINGGTPSTDTLPYVQTVFGPTEWRDVKLVVTNPNGCVDSAVKQLYV
ncbi:MAG: hypothetical protein GXO48_01230, partial [Chlorobi bacterium]|nr:hypothetical protein [Chlorobiota bacterium]